ncbi:MAG: preprotein translocase subunit SecE [Chloroflexi bacterium]|nr:preprotein translocase subunit SecE [Chloroflexota bacterium]
MSADNTIDEQKQGRRRRRRSVSEVRNRSAEETAPEAEAAEAEADEAFIEEIDDDGRGLTEGKGRATPGRRLQEETGRSNFLVRFVRGLGEYFEGVQSELGKVSWPTRQETIRLTRIVIVTLIITSLALGGISLAFTELFRIGLSTPIILIGFMTISVGLGLFINYRRNRRGGGLR